MRRFHRSAILALLFVAAAASGASCGFPEIEFFGSTSGATTGSGGTSATSSSATSGGGSATESSTASSSSASSSSSGDSLPCDGGPCDCDGDGERSWKCDGGTDCADYDPRAHHGAAFPDTEGPILFEKKDFTPPFDFNCSAVEEAETLTLSCSTLCPEKNAFMEETKCGMTGTLGHCEVALMSGLCKKVSDGKTKYQRCF